MRPSNKRSRSKSNRPKPLGNIVNRVFDSSGPEGKVRGTPQQIIDKYLVLARDAQLSGDRVAAENFLQHAEHYLRMLSEAQRELARESEARREQFQQPQFANGQPRRHDQRDQDQRDQEARGTDHRGGDQRGQESRGNDQRGGDAEPREVSHEHAQRSRERERDRRERPDTQPAAAEMTGDSAPAETLPRSELPAEPRRNRRAGRPPRAETAASDPRDALSGSADDGESMLVETPESRAGEPPAVTQAADDSAPDEGAKPRAATRRAPRKPRASGPADAPRAAE